MLFKFCELTALLYYFRMELPRFKVIQPKYPLKVLVKPNVSTNFNLCSYKNMFNIIINTHIVYLF